MTLINNFLRNISEKFGLSTPVELNYSSGELINKKIEQDTLGSTPLSQYLSYRYYDGGENLFFNEDGILGFMLEISPIVGSEDKLEKNLNLFFNNELLDDVYMQFLLIASHDIDEKIEFWKSERNKSNNKSLERLTLYREQFLRERAHDFSLCDGRMSRDFRIYISCSYKIGKDNEKKANSQNDKKLENIRKFKHKLYRKLEAIKLFPRVCDASDLIYIVGSIAGMQLAPRKRKKYDRLNCLSTQVLSPMQRIFVEDEAIIHEDENLVSKCFYLNALPEEYSLMEMIELLGAIESEGSIPARLILSYSLATNINKANSEAVLVKGHRAIHASEQFYTRNDTNLKKEAKEWKEIIARSKSGERFLTENMSVMITSTKEEIETAEEKIKSLYNSKDWQLMINKNLQLPSMLSILPMQGALYWDFLKHFQLIKTVQSREVVAKLPIHGEWKGVGRSGVLLIGRRGELFNWNPYVRIGGGGNYNTCVMAPSGSGKSFFLQELASSMMAQGTAVFIMDIGASYQNVAELTGGETIRFNKQNQVSLNPFASLSGSGAVYVKASEMISEGFSDDEILRTLSLNEEALESLKKAKENDSSGHEHYHYSNGSASTDTIEILQIGKHFVTKDSIIYAKSIISTMCNVQNDAHKQAIIEEAISKGIEEHGSNLDISKLARVLLAQKNNLAAVALSETLFPYTEQGMHGRFFRAGKPASFKEILTVFEFEEIKNDQVLLSVVLQVVLMQITMQFLCGDRSKKFLLIVDEAWKIIKFSSSFLEEFSRIVRKYGGSLVTCVQDYSIFNSSKETTAIFENSTWKIVLMQEAEGLKSFRESDTFKNDIALIESIRKDAENKYSELLISSSGIKVVGRLVVDPYSCALYSTEDKDYKYLLDCKKKGISKDDAVKQLALKYGPLPDISKLIKDQAKEYPKTTSK